MLDPALISAALFLLLVLAGSVVLARRSPFTLLSLFLVLLLIHELVIRWLTNLAGLPSGAVQVFSLWKEVVLAVLLVRVAIPWLKARPWRSWRRMCVLDAVLGALLIWGAFRAAVSPNRLAGLAAFRDYFEPMAVLVIARGLRPSRSSLRRLTMAWAVLGLIVAALGVWQATAWTEAEYLAWGYGAPDGELGIPWVSIGGEIVIRPPSTVTGPNELGLHMALLAFLALSGLFIGRGKGRWAWVPAFLLFSACLFFTRSRSDLIGYLMGLALLVVVQVSAYSRSREWRLARMILPGALAITALVLVFKATGMGSHLLRTFENLRQEYHVQDTLEAIAFLRENPGGVGMGLVGPRIGAFFPKVAAYHVEGSLFQIAVEMGLIGLALWLVFWGLSLGRLAGNWRRVRDPLLRTLVSTAGAGWAAALVAFLFLPLMQSLTLMVWLWFLLGLGVSAEEVEAEWMGELSTHNRGWDLRWPIARWRLRGHGRAGA